MDPISKIKPTINLQKKRQCEKKYYYFTQKIISLIVNTQSQT